NLRDGAGGDAAAGDLFKVGARARDAAAGAAERERWTDDRGQTNYLVRERQSVFDARDGAAHRHIQPQVEQHLAEELAILRPLNRCQWGAEQFHVKLFEDASVGELDGEIETRLPAKRRQNAVGALALDDAPQDLDRQRLDIRGVGDAFIGHNGGRIR